MTLHEHALLAEWQSNRHLPPEVRLEEDYDALLDIVDFAINAPEFEPCKPGNTSPSTAANGLHGFSAAASTAGRN